MDYDAITIARLKHPYLSCGEGYVDVVGQLGADSYKLRERIPTRTGARTSFLSADLNEFYVALPQQGPHEDVIRVFQPQK